MDWAFRIYGERRKMPKRKKKVRHLKAGQADVKLQFRGNRIELTVVIPADMERRLARRLQRRVEKG